MFPAESVIPGSAVQIHVHGICVGTFHSMKCGLLVDRHWVWGQIA